MTDLLIIKIRIRSSSAEAEPVGDAQSARIVAQLQMFLLKSSENRTEGTDMRRTAAIRSAPRPIKIPPIAPISSAASLKPFEPVKLTTAISIRAQTVLIVSTMNFE